MALRPHTLLGEHELEQSPSQRCRGSPSGEGFDKCLTLSIEKCAGCRWERPIVGHKPLLDFFTGQVTEINSGLTLV